MAYVDEGSAVKGGGCGKFFPGPGGSGFWVLGRGGGRVKNHYLGKGTPLKPGRIERGEYL